MLKTNTDRAVSTGILIVLLMGLTLGVPTLGYTMEAMSKSDMRNVSGQAGADIRFDLRINSNEYGSKSGGNAGFVWSDPDGSPSLGVPQAGHLGLETIILQIETGMDDSVEHLELDIGEETSDGTTQDFLQIAATEDDPNTQENNVNDDDYNDGLFGYSDVTFESVDFEVRDTRIKYFAGGNAGGKLGRLEFDGDVGFDGTKLRVWSP